MNRIVIVIALLLLVGFSVERAEARRPGLIGARIVTPVERQVIRDTHILHRPNRIGHFYGNTVRRIHYTGRVMPRIFR